MITMWRRIFKNRFSTLYFMLGLLVSMFTLFDVLSAYNKSLQYEEDNRAFSYLEEAYLDISFSKYEYLDRLLELEQKDGVNIELTYSYVNIYGSDMGLILNILLQTNEGTHYTMESGMLPDIVTGTPSIAVGREYKKWIRERDGKQYLQLGTDEFLVTGMIGCPYSERQDGELVTTFRSLSEEQKRKLYEEKQVLLVLQSDTVGLQVPLQELYEQVKEIDPDAVVQVSAKEGIDYRPPVDTARFPFLGVIYVFCILISVLVSWYWIQARLREMAIRKAFGQGMWKITWLLLREMLLIFLLSGAVYAVLHLAAAALLEEQMEFRLHLDLTNIALVSAYFILTLFMSVLVPVRKVAKVQPAELVNMKG